MLSLTNFERYFFKSLDAIEPIALDQRKSGLRMLSRDLLYKLTHTLHMQHCFYVNKHGDCADLYG